MNEFNVKLDFVIEIVLDRDAKKRNGMAYENDGNHPNNIYTTIADRKGRRLRLQGVRRRFPRVPTPDDAINARHGIYYDTKTGTLAAVEFFKQLSRENGGVPAIIELDGRPGVKEVSEELAAKLK